jgi:hypothetical protein
MIEKRMPIQIDHSRSSVTTNEVPDPHYNNSECYGWNSYLGERSPLYLELRIGDCAGLQSDGLSNILQFTSGQQLNSFLFELNELLSEHVYPLRAQATPQTARRRATPYPSIPYAKPSRSPGNSRHDALPVFLGKPCATGERHAPQAVSDATAALARFTATTSLPATPASATISIGSSAPAYTPAEPDGLPCYDGSIAAGTRLGSPFKAGSDYLDGHGSCSSPSEWGFALIPR